VNDWLSNLTLTLTLTCHTHTHTYIQHVLRVRVRVRLVNSKWLTVKLRHCETRQQTCTKSWNKHETRMLTINVSIPKLKITRFVQFWPWQFDVWTTNMNAHTWLTEQEHRQLTDVGESELEKRQSPQNLQKWLFEVVICNVTIISLNMISKLYSVYDFHNK